MMPMLAEFIWNEQTLAVIGAFGVPISAIVCTAWYKMHKVRSENDLKRSMVERGMSAEDIERIVSAGPKEE